MWDGAGWEKWVWFNNQIPVYQNVMPRMCCVTRIVVWMLGITHTLNVKSSWINGIIGKQKFNTTVIRKLFVGKSQTNDIPNKSVERIHCLTYYTTRQWRLFDRKQNNNSVNFTRFMGWVAYDRVQIVFKRL